MFLGLEFGLIIGVFAGLLTFIPYLGAILGGILAIGLSTVQFWGDWNTILLVIGVFVLGQLMEGNFLTPKLVGNSVGLHLFPSACSIYFWIDIRISRNDIASP